MKNFLLLTLFFLSLFNFSVFSQAICPTKTLKVNKVNGQILDGGKLETPLPNIKVELREINENERLVSEVYTNKSGVFEFENIKKGKYFFNVYFVFNNDLYLTYRAVVKVNKTNSSKLKPSILIRYGVDCWNTEATVIN
jgi:5-hydroxyisourate hydrolase-like protein (transthyretin family)